MSLGPSAGGRSVSVPVARAPCCSLNLSVSRGSSSLDKGPRQRDTCHYVGMGTYVAFLRAVNVRPRWVRMADLTELLESSGYTDVDTHIQSGNVRLTTPMRSRGKLAAALHEQISLKFGFDVPVVLRTLDDLAELSRQIDDLGVPDLGEPLRSTYVTLLSEEPPPEWTAELQAWSVPGEAATVLGENVVAWYSRTMQNSKLPANSIWKRLPAVQTARNITVIRAILERWGE